MSKKEKKSKKFLTVENLNLENAETIVMLKQCADVLSDDTLKEVNNVCDNNILPAEKVAKELETYEEKIYEELDITPKNKSEVKSDEFDEEEIFFKSLDKKLKKMYKQVNGLSKNYDFAVSSSYLAEDSSYDVCIHFTRKVKGDK